MEHFAPVKLLVRSGKSGKFLRSTGRWTKRIETACNFPNTLNAIHTCLAKGLNEVELVLRFKDDDSDHCLPLIVR